ncbi:type IV secretion system protein [Paraburkholderia sabiae]|uniref:Type IV secretion system protein n=1 Tax=Paraburkholderia sabiae TaxID=273251 RepID=A0ABU9QR09_9BURK|nr:type IV secretion system protein [Paraburkholderia sabiae]WJZ79640.1 type IV secretion system protein [Paraburkholderia sabiae]CAD6562881.1 Type IV secretion system protein virB5 [Paraburkholderia sabiae]
MNVNDVERATRLLWAGRVAVTSLSMCAAVFAHAQGVPTISPAELAQQMVQVQQLMQQIENQEAQYRALTGNSSLGTIMNDASLRNYLPDQWQDIYDQAKSGSLSGISATMRSIERQEGMTDAATPGQQRYYDVLSANKAMNEQAYSATMARLNNIQSLMQQSNLTQDPAQKADLQNRMAAEEAMVSNEQTRLQLTAQLQAAELKLAEDQQEREFKNQFLGGANGQ